MELKNRELEILKNRKEFCTKARLIYNKKLPKKLLIAYAIGLLYTCIRTRVNPEEKISFLTTLMVVIVFLTVVIVLDHLRLLNKIKKDIKEVDEMIMSLKN